MKKLELHGRRWFQKSAGNTYFSAVAILDGEEIARINFKYGYGDQWLDDLTRLVVVNQLARGEKQQPWQFINELEKIADLAVFTNVLDVNRKRDLVL